MARGVRGILVDPDEAYRRYLAGEGVHELARSLGMSWRTLNSDLFTPGRPKLTPSQRRTHGLLRAAESKLRAVVVDGDVCLVPVMDCGVIVTALADASDAPTLQRFNWSASAGYPTTSRGRTADANVRMHKMICPGWDVVDHINRNPLDNRRANLRRVTQMQNVWNSAHRPHRFFQGVTARDGKFRAIITTGGKKRHLGTFGSADDAARAFDRAAVQDRGEYAVLNFPIGEGDTFDNLTLTPSVDRSGDGHWHGFITNGVCR